MPSIDDKRPRTTEHNRADNMQVQKFLMPKFLFFLSCANNGLCCTEACFCMAEPGSCLNPDETTVEVESEDDEVTP